MVRRPGWQLQWLPKVRGLIRVTKVPVEDIFPSGMEERAVHAHLPKRDRSRHGVKDSLVHDPLPKVAVSSVMLVGASVTWPGIVFPAEVMAVQDSVECHEEAIEDFTMVTIRAREEVPI